GTYVGIGVSVRQDSSTGYLTVINAFEDGSAYKAGVRAGDYILEVDNQTVKDEDPDQAVTRIRGEEGTTVSIKFKSVSQGKTITVDMERHSVDVPTVEKEMLKDNIGYIKITQFDKVTPDQFNEALKALEDDGMEGLIVDVRANPGGVLSSVVTILQNMLPKGTICYTEDKEGKGDTYTSDGTHKFDKPLVVLVDGNSASASEIFTGALKDYEMATIVGTTTYGKGIVQKIFPLGDGSCVKVTIARYYTPNGVCIHGTGIKPDIEIEYDASQMGDSYDIKLDNQVNKAIEVLEGKLK
ncbi:MAG: S41 family peptidase, partial [Lachnospiraceae bacterium]|nr:S41 family peptidase [Lachnospiraceae bacterium]